MKVDLDEGSGRLADSLLGSTLSRGGISSLDFWLNS